MSAAAGAQTGRSRTPWFAAFALIGLAASTASTWVHYRILNDPLYASFCDVSATFSCTEAYTSRFGAFGGVPVALFGLLFFAVVLALIALCSPSSTASRNLPGYIFRRLDDRTGGGAVSRVRVVLHSQRRVPAVCRHLRRGHRPVPALGIGHQVSHDESPHAHHRRSQASRSHAARPDRGGGFLSRPRSPRSWCFPSSR